MSLEIAYKIGMESPLIIENFGLWNREEGLHDFRKTRILSRRRRNLQRHQFKATGVFMREGSENHTDLDDYQ